MMVESVRVLASPVHYGCRKTYHLQPITSASHPPRGPPRLLPVVAAMLTHDRHCATSRMGTRSGIGVSMHLDGCRKRPWGNASLTCDENGHEDRHPRATGSGYHTAQDNLRHGLAQTSGEDYQQLHTPA